MPKGRWRLGSKKVRMKAQVFAGENKGSALKQKPKAFLNIRGRKHRDQREE